ncbi:hypothetical protein WICPIJ_009669 [Wickerhamomyces pijperi]|uniref:Uncharacterized protein n=1 Tax=Wickerhamomyces pijperi TaxID=599730 RepID=A0A9P8TBU9_WICPI|nr:hypothetical protein WICPIJ_009669 [Wickerhamomyces pijperi]
MPLESLGTLDESETFEDIPFSKELPNDENITNIDVTTKITIENNTFNVDKINLEDDTDQEGGDSQKTDGEGSLYTNIVSISLDPLTLETMDQIASEDPNNDDLIDADLQGEIQTEQISSSETETETTYVETLKLISPELLSDGLE